MSTYYEAPSSCYFPPLDPNILFSTQVSHPGITGKITV